MSWWEFGLVMLVLLPIAVLWIGCIFDVISRPDLSGGAKVLWIFGVLAFPIFGAIVYILRRPKLVVGTDSRLLDESWDLPTTPRSML